MLLHIHAFTRAPPLPIVRQAIFNAAPAVRTLMHKHGGKVVGKPVALSEKQRTRFAVKSILDVISKKPGRLDEKLAREMISIVQGSSDVLKKKLDVHQVAMVNRYVYMETWHRTFYSMLWYRGNAHTRL
jgi:small subunit ribosomal protein S7